MNLHEYQAKQVLANYGLPVPNGVVVRSIDEAVSALHDLPANTWVVKAQVHAGGRGKAGGVKLFTDKDEVRKFVRKLLHSRLVTYQTDSKGQPVNELLIEEASQIERELYLGAVVDRSLGKVVLIASAEGGVEIEKVAAKTPEKILTLPIDPLVGVMPFQGRKLGFQLGLDSDQIKQLVNIVANIGKLFIESDLSLLEINPLIITKAGKLVCLDCKMALDDNALFRQKQLDNFFDPTQEDERELRAKEWELNYISLDGNIGCMVNGAGLAMATMDLIKINGGEPANFLDVGGGATTERVTEAFKIILSDPKVKAVLINIFGGIVRCDLIAEGIIAAVNEVGIKVPIVVRLEGNRADEAGVLLNKSGLNIVAAKSLTDAALQVVTAVRKNS